jgi:uncharacterized protein YndB with AHSA1/START domain
MQNNTQKDIEHKKSTSASPLVVVAKLIRAPVEKVFDAWKNESLIRQWWGPEGFTCPMVKIDFRVGEKYFFEMKDQSGKSTWGTGVYSEIIPNKKIVYSDFFANADGEIISAAEAGVSDESEPSISFVTVEFEDLGENETKMTLNHEGLPASMHDDCVDGWSSSLDKLKRVVEKH